MCIQYRTDVQSLQPSLWAISLVPVALFLGGWLLFGGLGVAYLPGLVGAAVGPTDSAVGGLGLGLLKVISGVLALGLGALVALVVAQPLSGPALASLVRSQERRLGAPARPETPFFRDMIQSVQSVLIGLAIGVLLIATFGGLMGWSSGAHCNSLMGGLLVATTLIFEGVFSAMCWSYHRQLADPASVSFFGSFPAGTAWQLYGMGAIPFLFVGIYVGFFGRQIVTDRTTAEFPHLNKSSR